MWLWRRLRDLRAPKDLVPLSDEERFERIDGWNRGRGGDQVEGWEFLLFESATEYLAWAERVSAPPMLDSWDPARLRGRYYDD